MNVSLTPPPERSFPERRLQQRKEQLLSQIQAEQQWRRPQPRSQRRWPLPVGAGVAVAAIAIAMVVALLPTGRGGPDNAAAAVLSRLANRVAAQPLTPQPGQYLYIETKSEWGAFLGSCETRSVEHDRFWIGSDGSGLDRTIKEAGQFTSAADRATCLSMESTEPGVQYSLAARTSNDWSAPRCLELGPTSNWSSLSSDPKVLLQQINQLYHDSDPTPAHEWSHIVAILGPTDAPPTVRGNIYRAAALIPGVQSLGTVRDHEGRPGLGLAYGTDELIFDAQSGQVLGETETGVSAGWVVYLGEKVVNALPSQPPAPLDPPCTIRGGGTAQQIPGGSIMTGKGLSPGQ